MTNFSFCAWFLLASLTVGMVWCDPKISRVSRSTRSLVGQPSQEKFKVLVKEQGSNFSEEVIFDMTKQFVVYKVPGHRQISKSDVLSDYVSNVTVIRFAERGICYTRPHASNEPSLSLLKKSMDVVSSKKSSVKNGGELRSSEWTLKGEADRSRLGLNVIEFCDGLPIYELSLREQDGISVVRDNIRKKRKVRFPFCQNVFLYNTSACPNLTNNQLKTTCQFPIASCVHYVTCTGGMTFFRDKKRCTDKHDYVDVICCDIACP